MELFFAPLEGVTYPEYRLLSARMFPGIKEYFAPFVSPGSGGFTQDFLRKKLPDTGSVVRLVPQLMANNPEYFLENAKRIRDLGYDEINLNAGCPFGTVFSKHKGSGMLLDLESLDSFLYGVFSAADYPVSIKTRMGVESTEEFGKILEIYNKYPVSRLIIHARDRKGMYKSEPDLQGFKSAFYLSKNPVSYNGNIFSEEDLRELKCLVPELDSVMIGRGAVANPALPRMLTGGGALTLKEFAEFHDTLIESYLASGYDPGTVSRRMKELWYYMICLFPNSGKAHKNMLKSRTLQEYRAAFASLTQTSAFDGSAKFLNIQ